MTDSEIIDIAKSKLPEPENYPRNIVPVPVELSMIHTMTTGITPIENSIIEVFLS